MSLWRTRQNEVIMPAESFGQVEEQEEELYSEPVYYTEPQHVYVSCEHIYEAIAEEEREEEEEGKEAATAMESGSTAAMKLFSEAEDATLRTRRAALSRRVSRRRSFVLERECASSEGGRFF